MSAPIQQSTSYCTNYFTYLCIVCYAILSVQFAERSQPDRLCLVCSAVNQASLVSCLVRLLPVTIFSFRFPVQHHCTRATSPLVYGVPSPLRRPWLNPGLRRRIFNRPNVQNGNGANYRLQAELPRPSCRPTSSRFFQSANQTSNRPGLRQNLRTGRPEFHR